MNYKKYKQYETIKLKDRTWPDNEINEAPIWCSVDLRDGNQALPIPMDMDKKMKYFQMLVDMGFKEIEVGFPSASDTDYNFVRKLIEEKHIPEDVTIQVLTQSREHLIEKTFESLKGANKAVVHLYNSTSVKQREVVFKMSKEEIKKIAINGAELLNTFAKKYKDTDFIFEYSPESFPGTEIEYALEVCEAVLEVWDPTNEKKAIINIPSTVEMTTPNIFADQIEWFCRNLTKRKQVILSVHPHNDRGTGVASAELALLAGADRIEGTLFGNGERTGNADIMTLALNMFSKGIDAKIQVDNINDVVGIYQYCTGLTVHERHPYAGEFVYIAFSGSHQDAINKGLKAYKEQDDEIWEVPYLPIDPKDVGRDYQAIIRINSQSGKGGVAYIMETFFGFQMPKEMHPEFSKVVQKKSDKEGKELLPEEIKDLFDKTYLDLGEDYILKNYSIEMEDKYVNLKVNLSIDGNEKLIKSKGNGPIAAFINGLNEHYDKNYSVLKYYEHALTSGTDGEAVTYIQLIDKKGNKSFGVGVDENSEMSSMKAILSSIRKITP